MNVLPQVSEVLRDAAPKLPRASAIDDLAYLVNAGASGEPYLLVYVVMKNARRIPIRQKLEIEDRLREFLVNATSDDVHFRWRTADDQKEIRRMRGIIRPVSTLH